MNEHPLPEEPEVPELAALTRAVDPDPSLESAVVSALYARGALRRRRRRQAWIAAALAAAFTGGLLVGREVAESPSTRGIDDRAGGEQMRPAELSPGTTVTWF